MKSSVAALFAALTSIVGAQAVQGEPVDDYCQIATERRIKDTEDYQVYSHRVPIDSRTGTGSLPNRGPSWISRANMLDCQPNVWCVMHSRTGEIGSRPFSLESPLLEQVYKITDILCYTCGDLDEYEDENAVTVSVDLVGGGKRTIRVLMSPSSQSALQPQENLDIATAVIKKGPGKVSCFFLNADRVVSRRFSKRRPLYAAIHKVLRIQCTRD